MCGRGAGGGVARGRGGAGRAQVKDWGTPVGAISAVGKRPGHLPSIISKLRFHQLETPSGFLPGALSSGCSPTTFKLREIQSIPNNSNTHT